MTLIEYFYGWPLAVVIVSWIVCGIAAGSIADAKGYMYTLGCIGGGLFGVIGLLWVGFLPDRKAQKDLADIREMLLSELERGYNERLQAELPEQGDRQQSELWSLKTKSKGY